MPAQKLSQLLQSAYRTPWSTVAGSFLAMVVGNGPIVFVAFSLFMPALANEFGWSRSSLSLAIFCYSATGALAMPVFGVIIDRYGLRKPTAIGLVLFCIVLASVSTLIDSIFLLYFLYACLGFFGVSLTPLPYTKAVTAQFDHQRGLALGMSMAGYGVGAALVAVLAAYLITTLGWRNAYLILAIVVFLVAIFSITFLIAEPPRITDVLHKKGAALVSGNISGLSVKQALTGSSDFWLIAFALLLVSMAINGVVTHFIVMMTDRGLSMPESSSLLGALGLSSIFGRLFTGYLIDRIFAPRVAAIMFLLPLIAVLLLVLQLNNGLLIISAICLGIGLGAEVDIMGYVVGRYFGMRCFGEIYGYFLAVFAVGAGLGGYLLGLCYDHFGAYSHALWLVIAGVVVAVILFNLLGAYRYPVAKK